MKQAGHAHLLLDTMPGKTKLSGTVLITLMHSAALPEFKDEVIVAFGLQDKKKQILAPVLKPDGSTIFSCDASVLIQGDDCKLAGPYIHGTLPKQFLYISWKRDAEEAPLWVQRIKIPVSEIPLALISKCLSSGGTLCADITGRKPHDTTALKWTVQG